MSMAAVPEPALAPAPCACAPAAPEVPPEVPPEVHVPVFTGSGLEYFRIWVLNLLLTLATCGIYSAWAKVRRLQYFDRNTQLAGACFDFRGKPAAVLRGRILALVLLLVYHYAFGFSVGFALVMVGFLLLALPLLLRGALRFRLANTQYRGLWLGFGGGVAQSYLSYAGPVLVLAVPNVLFMLDTDTSAGMAAFSALGVVTALLYLAWPVMHGRAKAYQHRHLLFGNQASSYAVPAWRFYRLYLSIFVIGLLFIAALGGLVAVGRHIPFIAGASNGELEIGLLGVAAAVYLFYLLTGPYTQARVANLAWSNTRFPGARIVCAIPVRGYVLLQTRNALLTLASMGLYRPFAAVSAYRYRLAHIRVELDGDFEDALGRAAQGRHKAAGDGSADALGIDLSW